MPRLLWSAAAREALAGYREELELLGAARVADLRIRSIIEDAKTYARFPDRCQELKGRDGPPHRYGPCSGGYLFLTSADDATLIVLFVRDADMPDVLTELGS